ncbi:MAG: hypothetical protein CMJ65_06820 [Planctomycetaceae bacterium]|nr:hypothetical protein [Planctomycetaceae bacterium]
MWTRNRVFQSIIVAAVILASRPGYSQKPVNAIAPSDGPLKLFNGKDLAGLKTWLRDTREKDPRGVFSVKNGMLHISGNGLGYLRTASDYRDYHLVVEFKWGPRTWGNRKDRSRDSGVLVHAAGPDGSGGGTWMASIESQIIEGGCGDFIVIGGKYANGKPVPTRITCEVTKDRDGEAVWKKGDPRKQFRSGRVNWFGRDPDWKDILGFRGKRDVENVYGKWNRMEVTCRGDTIQVRINGILVNEAHQVFPRSGKILIQTEMAEMFVRRWELWPLDKIPKLGRVPQD